MSKAANASARPQAAAEIGSWELVVDRSLVTYSRGFAALLGLAPGATIRLADWGDLVAMEDRRAFYSALARAGTDDSGASEHRIVCADGCSRTVLAGWDTAGRNDAGERWVRGVIVDVTALRGGERAGASMFEQGFDAAPIGMSLADPRTGRFLRTNDALCAMLGRSREELARMTIADVTHPEDLAESALAVRELLSGGAADYHLEKRYLRADGSVCWAAVHLAPVRDGAGRIEALYAQKIDISAEKGVEAATAPLVRDAECLSRIRDALDNNRMALYWQPIVDLRSGEVVQRELLLRMIDAAGQVIAPNEFLPVAERYGVMAEIDRWVIRQAARIAADSGPVEFNLSAASIGDPVLLAALADAIADSGADPADLMIEVTGTAMMDRPDAGRRFAEAVRKLGCELALDDFGTGFSNLRHLKELPADHLKIDIEFVRNLAHDETDQHLVRGIVGLAAEFGQLTTAKGIEDETTLSKLLELGVTRGQGYLFGRPGPIDQPLDALPGARPVDHGCADPVAVVKAVFLAFKERNVIGAEALSHPELVIRSLRRPDRPYQGPDSIAEYFRDLDAAWDELRFLPSTFWKTDISVIAFGRVMAVTDGERRSLDTMWVFGFRDGLIASVDVFKQLPVSGTD